MSHLTLTDVEWINLQILTSIHAAVQADAAEACSRYGLDAALADHLRELHLDQLWSLILQVGDNSLFPPRPDLLALISAPAVLAGPLALVHQRLQPRVRSLPAEFGRAQPR